jgi:2,4-dienoyl-CoA reductase-like NADH-dependent reductase (Old Yellow Enzyme family)/thioredoxin reductase
MTIDSLFLPGKIGKLEIKNRLFMPPMTTHLVANDGSVTKELLDYYEERAKGGVGLIITETTHAEMEIARGSITGSNLRIDDQKYMIGLSELTDMVHMHGTRIFLQLTIGQGSFCPPFLYPRGVQPIAPSRGVNPLWPDWEARELSVGEIDRIVEAYGEAALRAKMARFDGLELHGHGMYLLAQFMSPYTNRRQDKFGDPAALPLALIHAVRSSVGPDFPISFRWNIDEFMEGGRTLAMSTADAKSFEQAGINAINISGGNFWVPGFATHSCPPMSYPQGHLKQVAKAIRDAVNIPVLLSSKIGDPFVANEILQRGQADFIGLGRSLLADPEWPRKTAEGRLADIRPCLRDLDGCINSVVAYRKIGCTVNAMCGREDRYRIRPASEPMKVVVVGGGVAGMEAARVAASRGHDVTLLEASDNLGGQAKLAAMIPFKEEFIHMIRYLDTQLYKLGVKVILGRGATPESVLAEKPGAVIIATGSRHYVPPIPGVDGPNVFLARDVISETAEATGEKIVVAGGGLVGCDTALFLSVKKRKQVTMIEQFTFEEVGFEPYDMNHMDLMKMLHENGVRVMTETKVVEITDAGVRTTDRNGINSEIAADGVVLALGAVADPGLRDALRSKVPRLYTIGDADRPGRKMINAIHQGFYVATLM